MQRFLLRLLRPVLLSALFLLCWAPLPAAPISTETEEKTSDDLLETVERRLQLMPDIALYKWNHSLPVDDPGREKALLQRMAKKGAAKGLPEELVRSFFTAQMKAAKMIQSRCFAEWQANPPTGRQSPDLNQTLRPSLDQIGDALLDELQQLHSKTASDPELWSRTQSSLRRALLQKGLPGEIAAAASTWPTK